MENKRTIIFGASGLVGRYLFEVFKNSGVPVTGTYNKNKRGGLVYFDILNSSIDDINLEGARHAIICSAMTGVDSCRANLNLSRNINVSGVERLIHDLDSKHIVPVYISSVYVFDGAGDYKEDDIRNPANEYGQQKKDVEDFILNSLDKFLVIRLGRVFGVNRKEGIFADALEKYKKNENIASNDYEELSLTYAGDIARGIEILLEKDKKGIFHIEYPGHKNRLEFIIDFFSHLGINGAKIKKCSMEELNFLEKRAKNQFSDSSKFISETSFKFTPLEKCYNLIKKNLD